MAQQTFSISGSISFGWGSMKKNIGFFIALLLICGVTSGILKMMDKMAEQTGSAVMSFVVALISLVINTLIGMGMVKIAIACAKEEKPDLGSLVDCYPLFFKYLFASIVYGLIVLGGILLFVVPGIIWAIRFGFYGYYIVEENAGITESLSKSFSLTRGAGWDLFCFNLLCFAINVAGLLCLMVGLFATIPTTMVALARVYRSLRANQAVITGPGPQAAGA